MNNPSNTFGKNKAWIISILLVIVLAVCVIVNWDWLHASYTGITQNHFKTGDKLYAKPELFDSRSKMNSLFVGRLIRPMNELDVDMMNINAQKKQTLRRRLNSSLTEFVISYKCTFDRERLSENKSAYIGNYVGSIIAAFGMSKETVGKDCFYAIQPNMISLNNFSRDFKMPDGYIFADNNYYVFAESLTGNEAASFIK